MKLDEKAKPRQPDAEKEEELVKEGNELWEVEVARASLWSLDN